MKIHTLEITVVEQEGKEQQGANMNILGNPRQISKAICGLLQSSVQFCMLIMEAITNAIGGTIKVETLSEEIKEVKP